MKIYNTVSYFLNNYEPTTEFLDGYYSKFAPHFKEYFAYHCYRPEEKKKLALIRYQELLPAIQENSDKMESRILKIVQKYESLYPVTFNQDVHMIVGAFGSNAFTHKQIFPDITFCLEKLSPEDVTLDAIIAHELGHALHNARTDQLGMEWAKLDWMSPYTTLLQEGVATYHSMQIVDIPESIYFTYDQQGEDWLAFAKANEKELATALIEDLKNLDQSDLFREWFSINGGTRFGATRFAYYLGYRIVENLVDKLGELEAVTLWRRSDYKKMLRDELALLTKGEQHVPVL